MPRLKLDIFSPDDQETKGPAPEQKKETRGTFELERSIRELATPTPQNELKPKFVPVGFHPEHLRILDEAVMGLRRRGYWQSSKSGIIRRLIEKHAGHLDEIWLDGLRNRSEDQPASPDKQQD